MKRIPKLNAAWLPYIAAVTQAIMYSFAAHVYYGRWYIGFLSGIIPSVSIAYASSRIADISKKRKPLAYAAGGMLFLLSPLSVAPALYMELTGLIPPPWVMGVVAGTWAILPDAGIALAGFVAGQVMTAATTQPEGATGNATPKVARKKKKIARQPITDAALLEFAALNPGATYTEVAEHFGVSRPAVTKRLKKLYEVK